MSILLERLRHETRPAHEQTEQLFYTEALQNGTLSVPEYTHLLRTHFVFHQSLESAVDRHPSFFGAYQPERRKKTAWLVADLTYLGEPLPASMTDLFADWSTADLLGATYVGEGSMLGGSVIGRLLRKNTTLQPIMEYARFYGGYGAETGNYWRDFGDFLTVNGALHADEVVVAASRTFTIYQAIFDEVNKSANQ
ncbi:biliverdin-producing heme oxygenase [Spirosoma sp.]|uniref:biliverdin-producing heme oxygenase n=1 Tax=Spirosoma sp. TaxID=1899569 RepID=UPI002615B330|nr:biliverdin-producing heme oxygenase [Spirosoma sp.]MCX6218068.1 biliverdin-producing heme oxygenase [Spirosoma sp.]